MKRLLLFILICSSCNYTPSNEHEEVFIDIRTETNSDDALKDSIFNKQVIVTNNIDLFELGKNVYIVKMYYQGPDSLMSFWGGFVEEDEFNKAKYHWTSDSSINMTLFNTTNDSSKVVFLRGSMDGKGGHNGYVN